jgi:hypothetical protein
MLVMALTAVGCSCGGDDYYCDDTGCYYCDGLGCREADPPVQQPCTGDWQCAAEQVCSEDGCVERCTLDEQCADGTVCLDTGFCLPPGADDPILRPGACATSEECGDGGLCQDGMCIADPNLPDDGGGNPNDPNDPTDPPDPTDPTDPNDPSDPNDPDPNDPGNGGEVPVGPAPQCTVQADCWDGWDCINAVCKLGCSSDSQCGPGCECNEDGWCAGPGYDE